MTEIDFDLGGALGGEITAAALARQVGCARHTMARRIKRMGPKPWWRQQGRQILVDLDKLKAEKADFLTQAELGRLVHDHEERLGRAEEQLGRLEANTQTAVRNLVSRLERVERAAGVR